MVVTCLNYDAKEGPIILQLKATSKINRSRFVARRRHVGLCKWTRLFSKNAALLYEFKGIRVLLGSPTDTTIG